MPTQTDRRRLGMLLRRLNDRLGVLDAIVVARSGQQCLLIARAVQEKTMEFDVMTRATTWDHVADLARRTEAAGFSGMLFTEGQQVPWMNIAAAALAAPSLHFSTGIAIAFARSPMISAQIAWELAQNTRGRFRLGLGSQVKAHITRRYASTFDKPAPQMKDYVQAVKACLRAFRREGPLSHDGHYYKLSLLTEQWTPSRHEHEDIKVDISAVGPFMVRVAGEVADGVHVHPMHSMHYIRSHLLPGLAEGAARSGRDPATIDKIIPVIVAAGDTPEAQAAPIKEAKTTIAFYGATPNYAFQFDDLGHHGLRDQLRDSLKTNDSARSQALITDEILDQFAIVARWDDVADRMIERYKGIASRLVIYLTSPGQDVDARTFARWGEVARAVRQAG
jgi:probable F420-dependent oxidoreductase